MSTIIGHAAIDELGNISGGQAGDQTGREVYTRDWYLHSKGWTVYRPKDSSAAEKIAKNMEYACECQALGYDQSQRNTLYNHVKTKNFDCSKVTTPVETDCSALVRVCCAYAGIILPNFNTSTEHSVLMNSGHFIKFTDSKHCNSGDYLKRGDILCTSRKAHTVIVLTDGSKANDDRQKVTGSPISQGVCIDLEYANVREIPNGEIVGRVEAGEKVDIYAEENNWYKIDYEGYFAYIYAPLVKIIEKEPEKVMYIAYCNDTALNVRKSPNGTKIDVLNYADEVRVLAEEGSWLKIDLDGTVGYVYKQYIDKESVIKFWGTVNDTDLNIRANATSSSKKLGTFKFGDRVYVIGTSGSWYKIRYCGQDAWVYSSYIDKDGQVNTKIVNGKVTASSLYVRKGPSSVYGKLGALKNGTVVEIYEEKNGWYRISYGQDFGWVSAKYIQR